MSLISQILAEGPRTRSFWNARFEHWERPPSDTEEIQINRAASMVRTALVGNAWLQAENVTIAPQGSYFNNTNVRLESDMDLRAVHPLIRIEYHLGVLVECAQRRRHLHRRVAECRRRRRGFCRCRGDAQPRLAAQAHRHGDQRRHDQRQQGDRGKDGQRRQPAGPRSRSRVRQHGRRRRQWQRPRIGKRLGQRHPERARHQFHQFRHGDGRYGRDLDGRRAGLGVERGDDHRKRRL